MSITVFLKVLLTLALVFFCNVLSSAIPADIALIGYSRSTGTEVVIDVRATDTLLE